MNNDVEFAPVNVSMIGPFPHIWGGRIKGGGAATHVQGLISVLHQYGVRLRILADNTDAARPVYIPELDDKVQVRYMIRPQGLYAPRGLARLGVGRVSRITWKILSQSHLRRAAPLSYQLKFIAQAANFDQFLTQQPAEIVHVHHAEFRQYLCQQVLGVDTPLVATAHSVNVLVRPFPDWLVSLVTSNYRQADWLIAVSNYVKDVIVQHGADPDRITVIPNGVNIETFICGDSAMARERLDLPQNDFIVLFTGNLIPRKGVDVLLRAFQQLADKHQNMRLVFIGRGPERENLTTLATELGVATRVTFAGYKPLTEMPLWYRACNVFVMPSWAEGLSVSVLEALACGRPVITTFPEIGEHDAVKPGETGLLVDYGDAHQLTQALDQLASLPELRRRLGENARRLVEHEFSWDIVGYKTVQVYRTLLAER